MSYSLEDTYYIYQNYERMKNFQRMIPRGKNHPNPDPKGQAPDDFSVPRVELFMKRWMEVQTKIISAMYDGLKSKTSEPWIVHNYMLSGPIQRAFFHEPTTAFQAPLPDNMWKDVVRSMLFECEEQARAVYDLMKVLNLF